MEAHLSINFLFYENDIINACDMTIITQRSLIALTSLNGKHLMYSYFVYFCLLLMLVKK